MVKSKGGNFVFPSSSFCRDHSTIQVFAKDRVAASRHQPYPEFPAGQVSAWPLSTARKTKKAVSLLQLTACFCCGAPEEIRTPGLQVRSLLLYPAELRARREKLCIENSSRSQAFSKRIFQKNKRMPEKTHRPPWRRRSLPRTAPPCGQK